MFSIPVDALSPGFRLREPDDTPGFRVSNDSPGFRVSDDGLVRSDRVPVGGSPMRDPAQWTTNWARPLYVNANGGPSDFFGRLFSDVQDAAEWAGTNANAVVNGAYSIFPGTYDELRALARGVGLLGPEEFRRFGQEADFIGDSLGQIVRHPGAAYRAATDALSVLAQNPLLIPYFLGRVPMGYFTGLGPVAAMGGALRAVENGHNLIDSILQHGVVGVPSARP
jgi:hypothetical protein